MQSNHASILLIKPLPPSNIIQKINLIVFMAQEGSEASVANSSPMPNWWINTNPISSWNIAMNPQWQPHTNSSNGEDQEMMSNISTTSFTNASNHSGLSMDSLSVQLSGETTEHQLSSQVLYGVENNGGDLHNNGGENFLDMLSCKNLATELLNPACDYLKKLDSSWEFTNHALINHTQIDNLEKHIMNSYNIRTTIEPNRLTNLSDLVNWSIAPPNTTSNSSQFKYEMPSYVHGSYHIAEASESSLLRPFSSTNGLGNQVGLNNSLIGINNNKFCNGVSSDAHLSNSARTFSDLLSFNSKPSVNGSELSKKQGHENSSSTKGSGRVSGTTSDGKKKRSEESSETVLIKKSKHESSNASSIKIQPPKVKLQEKISALQQIVSPFGKTDTASVLMEAINYIGFLHEQVQLLSDPYMKSSANKDHSSSGGLERKDRAEPKIDLRSRGLCLVPISCTPQIYRENTGPDHWPTYRGCLFR